ncbi:MAG TPA: hydroxymethylglutaryl-CoA lyase [Fimbriimonadaceae bacterium]|nr:hydroxymethylglutaryl-CoA lyase [Fimbriimonadaceae bacterium]
MEARDVRIIEVGPRDGLQNESLSVPTPLKLELIRALAAAGLDEIEATSFVSPKWVPQMGDAAELWPQLPKGPTYWALVPNVRGLERALEVGVDGIALFTAASEAFTQRNINMTIQESLDAFSEVIGRFRASVRRGRVRAYVSTAFECPYSGRIDPQTVVGVARSLLDLGVDELSLGDTIGVAAPPEVASLTQQILEIVPPARVAYHFHDTWGTALANVATALAFGIRAFDASAGGLGGCPYAPGAGGNLATEDLVYLLERSGYRTGVDLARLSRATLPVLSALGRAPAAKAQIAHLATPPSDGV